MTPGSAAPRVGIVFRPQLLPPERLPGFATAAEGGGYGDLWLWEDCFCEGGLTQAATALAGTGSIRVALGLMPVPLRNPALAAMEIATLARLHPGRFVPAAGHGVQPWMAQVGAKARSPMTLLREWVGAVRALLHGETVTVAGDYVNLDKVALDWPPPQVPPLLVGARRAKTLALAGELADGLVLDAGVSPDGVRRAIATADAARPHEVAVYLLCAAGPGAADRARAGLTDTGEPVEDTGEPLEARAAFGSPADVASLIGAYHAAGATSVVLQPTGDDPDVDATLALGAEAIALLAR
jgi:alkanesulfonate monooxygenase SsuD/methylene tetrahydromethanopterin reductase-like flavin-dependent oxidoreductase (luciferase family)